MQAGRNGRPPLARRSGRPAVGADDRAISPDIPRSGVAGRRSDRQRSGRGGWYARGGAAWRQQTTAVCRSFVSCFSPFLSFQVSVVATRMLVTASPPVV